MASKGYVVRGMKGARTVYAYGPGMGFSDACEEIPAHEFERLDAAAGARDHMVKLGCEASIFRVHDDGREERLPSYEEALALLDGATSSDAYLANVSTQLLATMRENDRLVALLGADPLAALEAAERRLLEAGGWRPSGDADYPGYWRDRGGRMCKQAVAILAERRRLAAKGGA